MEGKTTTKEERKKPLCVMCGALAEFISNNTEEFLCKKCVQIDLEAIKKR